MLVVSPLSPCAATVIALSKRQLLAVAGVRGARIESRRGSLWVTQDGDRRDVVLAPGETHVVERDAPVLVQALDTALLALRPAAEVAVQATGFWRRLREAMGRAAWRPRRFSV